MKPNPIGCAVQVVLTLSLWIAAFVVYDIKNALLVMFILGGLNFLCALLGWIPLIGPFLFWKASKSWAFSLFFIWFPEVNPTWVTSFIFWSSFIASIFFTITSVAFIAVLSTKKQ